MIRLFFLPLRCRITEQGVATDPGDDRSPVFKFVGGVFTKLAGHFRAALKKGEFIFAVDKNDKNNPAAADDWRISGSWKQTFDL